ncbi:hypothetical protein OE88DRAFT_1770005 [Heliocybe sulcata]|uniref:Xylanolytic transcriptional activator regulatory domain-containing protein n=1 Tax=Heliocybe sulcata TaxID=5364 RepID=A0A5C3MRZ4_9AGAM|nr:hypothetical protein OE88DRAFT_1770005 [Heliocybe sulcata]
MQLSDQSCARCSASGVQCTYLEAVKKRGPAKSAANDVEMRLGRMEDMLDKLDSQADEGNYQETLDPNAASSNSPTDYSRRGSPCGSYIDPDEPDSPQDASPGLIGSLRLLAGRSYVGKSSGLTFVQNAMTLRNEYRNKVHGSDSNMNQYATIGPRIRPEFWITNPWEDAKMPAPHPLIFHFPPDDLLTSLTDLYFAHLNIFYPLFHQPSFRQDIARKRHEQDHMFGVVVLVMCACAARWSKDRRVLADWSDSWHSAGWKYLNECTQVSRPLVEQPHLLDLQASALAAIFLHGSSAPQSAWAMVGTGIRKAQDIGIHRRRNPGTHVPTESYETWKRTFWVLVALDRDFSSALGRAFAIQDEDFDLDMPVECDDEYWPSSHSGLGFVQPVHKPSGLTYFSRYIKLDQILSFAQRTVYSVNKSKIMLGLVGPDWEQRLVSQLDSSLNEWVDSLPHHLRWDPQREDRVFFFQSAYLYCNYYRVRILVHRPFIPTPQKPSRLPFPSLTICTNAARSMANVMDVARRRIEGPFPPFVYVTLLTAAVVLLFKIWGGKKSGMPSDPAQEMDDLRKCWVALKQGEERWYSTGRLVDIISDLASVGDIPLSTSHTAVPNKRQRETDDISPTDSPDSLAVPSITAESAVDRYRVQIPSELIDPSKTSSSRFSSIPATNMTNTSLRASFNESDPAFGNMNANTSQAYPSNLGAHSSMTDANSVHATRLPEIYPARSVQDPVVATSSTPDDWANFLGPDCSGAAAGESAFAEFTPEQQSMPLDYSFEAWAAALAEFG